MGKTDLGEKQACTNCGAKFYDLRRRPATCPKCTTSFDPAEESVRSRRSRARVSANDAYEDDEEAVGAKAKRAGEEEEEEAEVTPEVDVEAEAEPLVEEDDDVAPVAGGDEIPEGFSEAEADLADETADDDSVPLLEDEEEFPEDEIGELPSKDDDDASR